MERKPTASKDTTVRKIKTAAPRKYFSLFNRRKRCQDPKIYFSISMSRTIAAKERLTSAVCPNIIESQHITMSSFPSVSVGWDPSHIAPMIGIDTIAHMGTKNNLVRRVFTVARCKWSNWMMVTPMSVSPLRPKIMQVTDAEVCITKTSD
jgi:hypothetical protein